MPYAVYRISPDGEVLDSLDRGLTLSEENAAALLVDYSKEHEGKRDIPFDMVIPDLIED